MESKKIVILGAGYAGVNAAKLLSKKFKKNTAVEVTLIDKNPYHTLMTELHEVAGGGVEEDSVQVNLRKIFRRSSVKIVTDTISNIDFEGKKLASETEEYLYDYLVIGAGSEPAYFGVPGVKENGFSLWSLEDALKIRAHIKKMFKLASTERNLKKKKEMLTFVVAGAGFTGIELVGELAEWKDKLCRDYDIDKNLVKLMVVEAMGKILPILDDNLAAKAESYMKKQGIEILLNSPIVEVNENSTVLKDGRKISTRTLIWTCGVQGCEFAANLGLGDVKRCRVQVNEKMQSIKYENVYMVGDNLYLEENGKPLPQIVETAMQTAETAVHNIIADIEGKEKKAFKSNYHGFMVSIGGKYAVASAGGIKTSGFFAMVMKHLVNMHYLFGIGGIETVWAYLVHEFFSMKEGRTIMGSHLSEKSQTLWLVPLRIYIGVLWLMEGIGKIQQGWLKSDHIYIVATSAVSGASEKVADVASSASQVVKEAQKAAEHVSLLSQPPEIFTSFMNTFIAPHAHFFQVMIVLGEVALGLAFIAGAFTFLASLGSIFLCCNFILSAMAGKEILWYIFGAIVLMGGSGRAFGLDYYIMPWLGKLWRGEFKKEAVSESMTLSS
ncbi:MAG: NADH dehydrogenase FAD-containing subunit [Clostridiaceae bacterium]|nr:NADH dehydrogenase FAD-containing subunit [Clostridiaceae bacterium]